MNTLQAINIIDNSRIILKSIIIFFLTAEFIVTARFNVRVITTVN